ncbi:heat-inducible transcriptional repressor HrcA [Woodsholea maritima]|uniref:heat-inducible transcriptional repressor HrcA n=1 Tax=Woodsholea maritima TaxID=240237 RepID=UPI0003664501|nr:heat-inducible transcriptional repressor HrcA [Woodsholea maritima]
MTPFQRTTPSLSDLDDRSRHIFRAVVEAYLSSGDPVGSRTLSKMQGLSLSPASIRNTLSDLAAAGLLTAPHASAGRLPTHAGLRLFVDGLLQIGELSDSERRTIDGQVAGQGKRVDDILGEVSAALAGLAGGAGLVASPKRDNALRHIEFVPISPHEILAVLVFTDGTIENRLMTPPMGLPASALVEAGNFLSAQLVGRTISEAVGDISQQLQKERAQLDDAATHLIELGLADWAGSESQTLIVRGQAKLLDNVQAAEDLERIRLLFEDIERKQDLLALLEKAQDGRGVRLFIGSENPLFSLSGSSVIVAPYRDKNNKILGALGVIGPTRLNYARVIPLVDYTAQAVSRLLSPH